MCHIFLAFYIGINPYFHKVLHKNNSSILSMKTEILEKRCAEALHGYAQTMADAYTTEPEDFDAAVTALLARTLELHLNRTINLENLYK
jgi:hypothetical protein